MDMITLKAVCECSWPDPSARRHTLADSGDEGKMDASKTRGDVRQLWMRIKSGEQVMSSSSRCKSKGMRLISGAIRH
jgi:hypothetical protein